MVIGEEPKSALNIRKIRGLLVDALPFYFNDL